MSPLIASGAAAEVTFPLTHVGAQNRLIAWLPT